MAEENIQQKVDKFAELELNRGEIIQSEEDQKKIIQYVTDEINDVEGGVERKNMLDMVETWRRHREARPEEEEKSFPWDKASNIVPPLTMTNTNALAAALKSSLGPRKPFWSVSTDDPQKQEQAEALELLLAALAESKSHMNLREANKKIFNDLVLLGTEFVKVPWTVQRWNFKRRNPLGGGSETVSKIMKDCPEILGLRFEDFLTRPYWPDIQRAPWISHRNWLMEHELLQRQANGIFQDVEAVIHAGPSDLDENREKQLERMGIAIGQAQDMKMYPIYETHLYWDVDGDGFPEDIIIWFDTQTQTILRSEFNDLGVRDIVRLSYMERSDELYGMGVGWMIQPLQDALTSLMNMYIDGSMLSMLQMYVTRRGCGIAPNEKFRPLKNLIVDDPTSDFIPIKFPEVGTGNLQVQMMIKEFADRAVGTPDAMMGFESRATSARTTATGTMFLAQQGGKVFAAIREGIEEGESEMAKIAVFQLIRNRERAKGLYYLIPEEHHPALDAILATNVEEIPSTFNFKVQTTEIEKSEEARKQSILTLTQLYTLYGKQVFELIPTIYNPQVPKPVQELGQKFFVGATNLMEQVFKFFGEDKTQDYLPYIKDIEMMLTAMDNQKDQGIKQIKQQIGAQSGLSENSPEVEPTPGGNPGAGGPGAGPFVAGA